MWNYKFRKQALSLIQMYQTPFLPPQGIPDFKNTETQKSWEVSESMNEHKTCKKGIAIFSLHVGIEPVISCFDQKKYCQKQLSRLTGLMAQLVAIYLLVWSKQDITGWSPAWSKGIAVRFLQLHVRSWASLPRTSAI